MTAVDSQLHCRSNQCLHLIVYMQLSGCHLQSLVHVGVRGSLLCYLLVQT